LRTSIPLLNTSSKEHSELLEKELLNDKGLLELKMKEKSYLQNVNAD